MIAVGPRNRITVDGVTVLPSCAAIMDAPAPTADGEGWEVEIDYGGAWVTLRADPLPTSGNVGRFRLEVSVPHPGCEESDSTMTAYGYEFPSASRRIARFVRAVR